MKHLQKNRRLCQQLREFKLHFMEDYGNFSLKGFNDQIKRKTHQVAKGKFRYASLMEACRDTHNLLNCVESLQQQVKTLEGKLIAAQEENVNVSSAKERLVSILENTENDLAGLKQENGKLKSALEKTQNANAYFKQLQKQIKSVLKRTENDDAYLKCKYNIILPLCKYNSLSSSPFIL